MKKIALLLFLVVLSSCKTQNNSASKSSNLVASATDYVNIINAKDLKSLLYEFASDEMQGRMTGEQGQKLAAEYIKNFYIKNGISSPLGGDNYFQPIPSTYFKSGKIGDTENVIAFIEGSEYPEEVIVISAHYDHVGVDKQGQIFNGADDDGSGSVSLLLIAKAFQKAKAQGNGPKRSVVILHVTAEEIGLQGSKYYVENPIFPLKNTVVNLNVDMIGRIDPNKKANLEYIYLIGSDKLSQTLHNVSEEVNKTYGKLEIDYTFNDENDPNRFYYRSDHYNFAKNNIPVIFYFSGVHEDYHKPTDTPDKIEYNLLEKRARLIFYTAWEIANRKERIQVDVNK